ncbi:LysR family transcriptional regulator [Chitinophaga arvensicola]|uniref:DNA-binding transcriptional regulator, LysR family n=1 Tax=Chitinophaga arvensicola TaxID=29529 RepID=A0A1I0S754_9BACT|nr:LysR family transcriptional regulator [Chitinophaga arvensicola]SEW51543.1 DNA-binding transcriptional regulator, LysR family [Chitinophaga arvensicola]
MHTKILNLFKIKVLSEVCKTNSYKTASKHLFITPSAVSKIIKSLESEWNLQLVTSTGNNIKATAQAAQLAGLAEKLLQANDEFTDLLALLRAPHTAAVLQIGSGGAHSKLVMNRLLDSLTQSFPELKYDVVTNNSAEVLNAVDQGELDCGIVSGMIPDHISKELIFRDNISLYALHDHPLANNTVSLKDIPYLFCLREKGSSTRAAVEQFLSEHHLKLQNVKQTGKNDELTDQLCKTQHALQFISDFYYHNSSWSKTYVKINCPELQIPIAVYFITRNNFPFLELRKHIRKKLSGTKFWHTP